MAAIVICKIKHEVVTEMPIKHEVKLSALLVLRQCYRVLYFMYSKSYLGHALTVLKNLHMNV